MSHLAKNLAALRIHTPATAAIVESATIPQGYLAAVGSDHTPTFLRTATEPRELHWLGNTSMPTASAGPLTAALDATAAGLGLSIGTGYEWLAFCLRLGPAQPLYVYEPEGGQLRMALTICDLSEHLASGKIVIFSGSTEVAKDEIARFLSMHAGHEPPAVLHPLATLSAERRNALLAAGESVVRHGLQCRQALVNELAAKMQAVESEKWKGGKIAALIGAAHYSLERPLHFQMASDTPRLRLDQHGSCSLARRLEFVLEHTPGRIVSDFFRPDLGCIPPGIPVHTWVPPLVGPAFWQRLPAPAALLRNDRMIVHADVQRILLEIHGISAAQIELIPLPVPSRIIAREPGAAIAGSPRAVALIADLPRTDAHSLGLMLPTHQAIHAAAVDFIAADYLGVSFHSAADILRRALARAGVAADSDPALQEPMLRMIRDVLIPSVPLLTMARTLFDQQIPLLLIGDWANLDRAIAPIPLAEFCAEANRWHNTAALLHLSPWGNVSPLVLDAAAHEIPLVAPRHPADAFPGALPSLLAAGPGFLRPQPQQLLGTLKSAVRKGLAGNQ